MSIVSVSVSVNAGSIISVSVIVSVTEISLIAVSTLKTNVTDTVRTLHNSIGRVMYASCGKIRYSLQLECVRCNRSRALAVRWWRHLANRNISTSQVYLELAHLPVPSTHDLTRRRRRQVLFDSCKCPPWRHLQEITAYIKSPAPPAE